MLTGTQFPHLQFEPNHSLHSRRRLQASGARLKHMLRVATRRLPEGCWPALARGLGPARGRLRSFCVCHRGRRGGSPGSDSVVPGVPACPKGIAWPTCLSCFRLSTHLTGEDLSVLSGQTGHGGQGPGQISFHTTWPAPGPPETFVLGLCQSPKGIMPPARQSVKSMDTSNPGADTGSEAPLMPPLEWARAWLTL